MAIDPSPTADATRLTLPDRTSPTANTRADWFRGKGVLGRAAKAPRASRPTVRRDARNLRRRQRRKHVVGSDSDGRRGWRIRVGHDNACARAPFSTIACERSIAGAVRRIRVWPDRVRPARFSALLASRLASHFGLVRTMVATHLPSNILLILVPLMPTLARRRGTAGAV
jgi:hypothetical protein